MSARALASGTVSFGLVAIPVKLYSTSDSSSSIHFNQIHEKCGTRIRQQLYCPTCESVVTRDEIVKGYEFAKDQYVLFSEEELAQFHVNSSHEIEIREFVPLKEVDPIFFDTSYYLGPDKGGDRPYRLLTEAMKETERAALGTYAARGKQYLVLLRPFQEGLILQQLRYADELRAFSEVPLGSAEIKPAELDMAKQLVEQTASDRFDPTAYRDEMKERLQAVIEQKIQGRQISVPPAEAPKAQIIDLMEALKASLGQVQGEKKTAGRKPPRAAPRKPAQKKKKTAPARARKVAKK